MNDHTENNSGVVTEFPGEAFRDNFDYLAALGQEVRGWLEAGTGPAGERHRERTRRALAAGVDLPLERLAARFDLDPFERRVVQLLFALATVPACREAFEQRARFSRGGEATIGEVLALLCPDERARFAHRRYFAAAGQLIQGRLLDRTGGPRRGEDILEAGLSLPGSLIRFILGDENDYQTGPAWVRRERAAVTLEQVILPETLKTRVWSLVAEHYRRRPGEGLALLFHGPAGTGKTTLARALAAAQGRELLVAEIAQAGEILSDHEMQELLTLLGREARLRDAVVLINGCHGLLDVRNNSRDLFLEELARYRGLVILATAKSLQLDAATERLLAGRFLFFLPAQPERLRLWQTLRPAGVDYDPALDLAGLAARYRFSGGLIGQVLATAAQAAAGRGEPALLTGYDLEAAAAPLSSSRFEELEEGPVRQPVIRLDELPLAAAARAGLEQAAAELRRGLASEVGLALVLDTRDPQHGLACAEALAGAAGLRVRELPLRRLFESVREMDGRTRRMRDHLLLDLALGPDLGQRSLLVLTDPAGELGRQIGGQGDRDQGTALLARLRSHSGFVAVVTPWPGGVALPLEFQGRLELDPAPADAQLAQWQHHYPGLAEDEAAAFVREHPLPLVEIDLLARRLRTGERLAGREPSFRPEELKRVLEDSRPKAANSD